MGLGSSLATWMAGGPAGWLAGLLSMWLDGCPVGRLAPQWGGRLAGRTAKISGRPAGQLVVG
eukprot:3972174-Alexandrium_andersonii.AAC.1